MWSEENGNSGPKMESGGGGGGGSAAAIESSADDNSLLCGGGDSPSNKQNLEAVHLQKIKLATTTNKFSEKILDPEPLQIVELGDHHIDGPLAVKGAMLATNSVTATTTRKGHGHEIPELIDFAAEKSDVTPENLQKRDQDLLIDLDAEDAASAPIDCDTTDSSVQLTLLDLDEPPPAAVQPEKSKAFTISFGDEQRSQEQKQKYEKMFERFQNKRHKRGQSLSKVEVVVEAEVPAVRPANRVAPKTPSSAKLPRKTFSEPSSKVSE